MEQLKSFTDQQLYDELHRRTKEARAEWEKGRSSANSRMQEQLTLAQAHLANATAIADEYGLYFSWDACGYGMGGGYQGVGRFKEDNEDDWQSSNETGWISSSSQC